MPRRANGEGSVFWSESHDRFIANVTVGPGKRKTFYGKRGDRSRSAKMLVTERMRPFLGRTLDADDDVTLGVFLQQSLARADVREKTRDVYETAAKHIHNDVIARKEIFDISPVDVRAFYDRIDTGPTMKQKVHSLLHRTFEEAFNLELVHRNPCARVPKPRVPRSDRAVWTPEEALFFLRVLEGGRRGPHRYHALFLLALTSTMGPAELFGLQRRNVHLQGGYVRVATDLVTVKGRVVLGDTKTADRRRKLYLPAAAVDALRDRLKQVLAEGHGGSPFVFTSPEGKPVRSENFRRRVWTPLIERTARIAERLARATDPHYRFPRLRPYELRHTANALMGHLDVPIEVARERMGHSSIKLTADVYGHNYDSQGREVASKFDAFLKGDSRTAIRTATERNERIIST